MKIEICRIRDGVNLPKYVPDTAACFDFEAAEAVTAAPGEVFKVLTGLVIRVPSGYGLIVAPRSSSVKKGISMPHSVGIVDPMYCGKGDEIIIYLKNNNNASLQIEKGERIAQGMFVELPKIEWSEIGEDSLEKKDRGGFGSTDVKNS